MEQTIDWTRQARTDLNRLDRQDSDRIRRAVLRLAVSGQGDVEHLKGFEPPRYRLRVGSWRVMFRRENGNVSIVRVLHRREAYRKSAFIRQGISEVNGMHETEGYEMPPSIVE